MLGARLMFTDLPLRPGHPDTLVRQAAIWFYNTLTPEVLLRSSLLAFISRRLALLLLNMIEQRGDSFTPAL